MSTGTWIRSGMLVLCMLVAFGCAPRAPRVASPAPVATHAAEPREPASDRELARYAERERQASDLAEFEGGRRGAQTTTIIIVLLIVIIVLILV